MVPRILSVLAAAGLVAASSLAVSVAPASASGEGVGSGRALVRGHLRLQLDAHVVDDL